MTDRAQRALAQWVALSLVPHLGGRTLARLLERFGSLDAILTASEPELRAVPRVGPQLATAIRAIDLDRTEASLRGWQQDGLHILTQAHPAYPPALRGLEDAPPVLFVLGAPGWENARGVALVGTRRPSQEARTLAHEGAAALAAHGWAVVSGLAAGIDAAAHRGALAAGGTTLAVLGSGVQCVYPREHRALAHQIAAQGALLSEVAPSARPTSATLVARNRVISGLSRAVVIVEAGASSGSLYAAQFARAQGRAVFAVQSSAAGNQRMLTEGALPLPCDGARWHEGLEFILQSG